MRDQLIVIRIAKRGEAQERRVIAMFDEHRRLGDRLSGFADRAANPHEWTRWSTAVGAIHFLTRQSEDRLEQTDVRIANGELSRVNANSESPCAGGCVVARERSLMSLIEAPIPIERERMRRNDQPARQRRPQLLKRHAMNNRIRVNPC
jgi:hypothetical protein